MSGVTLPSGEMAMATGPLPTAIGVPALMVRETAVRATAPAGTCPPAMVDKEKADRLAAVVAIVRVCKAPAVVLAPIS